MADVRIRIGTETRNLEDASESWITDQINRRKKDGQSVCVEVVIHTSGLNIRLATPGCGSAGRGGGRPPTANEQSIFRLWDERGLDSDGFAGGNLVAFLKQLRRLL